MSYILYNKHLDKKLSHPKYGLWHTSNINEARDMMKACHEYLVSMRIPEQEFSNFVILDMETGQEIE